MTLKLQTKRYIDVDIITYIYITHVCLERERENGSFQVRIGEADIVEEEELSPRERQLEREWGKMSDRRRERERESAEEGRRGEEWSGREC